MRGHELRDLLPAAAEIREMRKGMSLGELKIKDLIDEGRK
jgi:hypothetical protein